MSSHSAHQFAFRLSLSHTSPCVFLYFARRMLEAAGGRVGDLEVTAATAGEEATVMDEETDMESM